MYIHTKRLLFPAVSSFKRQTPCHKVGRNLFLASSSKSTLIRLKAKEIPWLIESLSFSSVQLLSYVGLLWPQGPQHARHSCPSPTPLVNSNSCPFRRWCHPTISSSVIPFSSCFQSFPASGSFPMSQFFASAGQSIGVSASASVLPMNTQDWSPLGWTKGTLKSLLQHHSKKASILWHSAFFIV